MCAKFDCGPTGVQTHTQTDTHTDTGTLQPYTVDAGKLTMINILHFSREHSATRERGEEIGTVVDQLVDIQPSKKLESE